MTQEDEAREMMGCQRCGAFSGPELLCARCERERDAICDAASDQPFTSCAHCNGTIWLARAGWDYDKRSGFAHSACR